MTIKKLDFTGLYSVCGDPSSHLTEALASMAPGDKLEVAYRENDSSVKEALKLIEESGIAKIESVSCEKGVCKAILVRSG
ncbi:hypothetical protein Pyrfu_0029 [Pyrolobus fumarii 1A]|uniref:SirA-like domain-containing protein n=1 Tax=Pyrolobus fumarii (strain DSM 11204 / 1A) TaxID=694429 RepID=G0EDY5_PYRF1|nr:hypothetical protein [Pyrolobus fumarii]AEM37901.1 hypothetical protein Pyrfu_0029 [Pyrolobus fumarii 1A]